jgi:2-dehydro-3-deoxygluconokinase
VISEASRTGQAPNATPKIVAVGELLLRLKAPGNERLLQSPQLEATFGGTESNVIASLSQFGLRTAMVSALPPNAIGDAGVAHLRAFGIDTAHVVRQGDRVGTYYLEAGAGVRPSSVIYDRAGSSMATARRGDFDWDAILSQATWLHLSGITPAISASAAGVCLDAARAARAKGITVSCDYNHRAKLWQYGKSPREVMPELVREVDVGIAGREDCQTMLGIEMAPRSAATGEGVDPAAFKIIAERVLEAFPNLKVQAITLRDSRSAETHGWSACLRDRHGFFVSRQYHIAGAVDRVGAGDAFAAGLIYGMVSGAGNQQALELATAASCLKHFVPGDVNRATLAEVEAVMRGEGGGRVQR